MRNGSSGFFVGGVFDLVCDVVEVFGFAEDKCKVIFCVRKYFGFGVINNNKDK